MILEHHHKVHSIYFIYLHFLKFQEIKRTQKIAVVRYGKIQKYFCHGYQLKVVEDMGFPQNLHGEPKLV